MLARLSLFPLLYMVSLSFQPNGGLPRRDRAHPDAPDGAELRPGVDGEQLQPLLRQQPLRGVRHGRHHRRLRVARRVRLRPLPVPAEGDDLLRLPRQPRGAEPAAAHPAVPADGPAPSPRTRSSAWSLIYVASNLPFTIFLLRGFFEAIPREFEESFRLDGAGTLRVLTQPDRAALVPGARRRLDVHLQRRVGGVPDRADDDQTRRPTTRCQSDSPTSSACTPSPGDHSSPPR